MGVTASDQTSLHTDSLPNALNTNKSVPSTACRCGHSWLVWVRTHS